MSDATVSVPGVSRERVTYFLMKELPDALSGRGPDPWGIAVAAQSRMIQAALEDVNADFVAKSQGGAGADGTVWEPLHPLTIKLRAEKKGLSGQPGAKGGLSEEQYRAILQNKQEIYKREYARLRRGGLSVKEARRQAAILSRFLGRQVYRARLAAEGKGRAGEGAPPAGEFPILDETGRLKASTAPGEVSGTGLGASYLPLSPDQVVTNEPGKVSVESEVLTEDGVNYGDAHMRPGRGSKTGGYRPARPWKYPDDVPEEWLARWAQVYADAVAEMLPGVMSQLR
jgi:hypothetical protein